MKIELQITSLEISKKLREVGVKQESYLSWVKPPQSDWYLMQVDDVRGRTNLLAGGYEVYSAFLVGEILDLLPANISGKRLQIDKMPQGEYWISYVSLTKDPEDEVVIIGSKNIADAIAEMYIRLKREGLLEKDK